MPGQIFLEHFNFNHMFFMCWMFGNEFVYVTIIYLFILFIMSYLPMSTPSVCNIVLPGAPALHT